MIDQIKQDIGLVTWLQQQGYELKKHGQDYVMACPWHEDKTPSLVVSPDTNLWHCMGACQTGGSIIDWLMKTEGLNFRDAVKELIPLLGEAAPTPQKTPKPEPLSLLAAEPQALLQPLLAHYHDNLKQSPDAVAYLKQRGLDDAALIDHFKLGFADGSFLKTLASKHSQAGRDIRQQLQAVGWCRSTGHEHFRGCLIMPVLDEQGRVSCIFWPIMNTLSDRS